MSSYYEVEQFLFTQFPNYQKYGQKAFNPSIEMSKRFAAFHNNPEKDLRLIHVAGTNGKGTSAHSIASILQSAGYQTGLYTSPHLKSFTERIRINGCEISEEAVVDFVSRLKPTIEAVRPSFFEVTVAMAFDYFYSQMVDIAVIEVGLGGRLDSTNVITPEVSLITSIGFDHTDLLGNTLAQIASEKAGIIKHRIPVVIGDEQSETWPVFKEKADREQSPLIRAPETVQLVADHGEDRTIRFQGKDYQIDILSDYYLKNLPGIFETVNTLNKKTWNISEIAIKEGLKHVKQATGLKGRFQILDRSPFVIADISHNEPGLNALLRQIANLSYDHLHLIYGTVKDKDLKSILPLLELPKTTYYFTQSQVPRSLSYIELTEEAGALGLNGEAFEDVNLALQEARKNANSNDLILITGSTFVVAEIEEL